MAPYSCGGWGGDYGYPVTVRKTIQRAWTHRASNEKMICYILLFVRFLCDQCTIYVRSDIRIVQVGVKIYSTPHPAQMNRQRIVHDIKRADMQYCRYELSRMHALCGHYQYLPPPHPELGSIVQTICATASAKNEID